MLIFIKKYRPISLTYEILKFYTTKNQKKVLFKLINSTTEYW